MVNQQAAAQAPGTPGKAENDIVISIRNLSVVLGGRTILDGLDLDVKKGKTIAVMGLSGMGKSTTIRCIMRLQEPDEGEIFIYNRDILKMKAEELHDVRQKMGMVFQKAALFDSMTVAENVGFGLREHTKMKDHEIRKIVDEKLAIVDLSGKGDFLPAELSGGMQKRASLARAICTNPEIILYDEPTTGLDPILCCQINQLIMDLQQRFKVTSILVTHDLSSAYAVADEIAMLHDGKIIERGDPEHFRNSPNPFVQQFVRGCTLGPIKV
jgi:phospholipid/cholesterol/gamma-HCH transport system ATP-binding protein